MQISREEAHYIKFYAIKSTDIEGLSQGVLSRLVVSCIAKHSMLETNHVHEPKVHLSSTTSTADQIRRATPLSKILQVKIGDTWSFTDEVEINDLLHTKSRRPFAWLDVELRFVDYGNFMIAVESGDESVSDLNSSVLGLRVGFRARARGQG
jgi:hypothetical protein